MKIKLIAIFIAILFLTSTPVYSDNCDCKIIVEYKIVMVQDTFGSRGKSFIVTINDLIKEGWVPQGGFSIGIGGHRQAMVKKVNKEVYEDMKNKEKK